MVLLLIKKNESPESREKASHPFQAFKTRTGVKESGNVVRRSVPTGRENRGGKFWTVVQDGRNRDRVVFGSETGKKETRRPRTPGQRDQGAARSERFTRFSFRCI